MLLKKIHHLKKKIESHISNMDLLEVVIEDNNDIRQELEKKDKEIQFLHKRISSLEKLNISYSKDVLLLSQAVAEQYEVLLSVVNKEMLLHDDFLELDFDSIEKKKKKKIVH